jgi:CRP/FNR family transcriptional regulator, nitrogen fixation regulation protein
MMSAQLAQAAVVHTLRPTVGPTSWSSDSDHFDLFQGLAARMTFERDAEIYGEGEAADFVYRVAGGCVRTYKVLADGRRQIGDFLLPGDVFGLEAGAEHALSAEAICRSEILVCRRSALFNMAQRSSDVGHALWSLTARELERAQSHLMLLGRKSACERVATFLQTLADRFPNDPEISLHMSRQDMADYLGLTIETVSRTFTQLQSEGVIALHGCRKVEVLSRQALRRKTH